MIYAQRLPFLRLDKYYDHLLTTHGQRLSELTDIVMTSRAHRSHSGHIILVVGILWKCAPQLDKTPESVSPQYKSALIRALL